MADREDIVGNKRIVREYDDAGKLLRIRVFRHVQPVAPAPPGTSGLTFGRKAPAAPTPTAAPPEPEVVARPAPPAPEPEVVAQPAATPEPDPLPAEPTPSPEPVVIAPLRKAPGIHVRFRDEPEQPGIDVVVSPYHAPSPPRLALTAQMPLPVVAPVVGPEPDSVPTTIAYHEPQAMAAAPVEEPPVEDSPVEPVRPTPMMRFEIVALEPIRAPEPEPEPEPVVARVPEPGPASEPIEAPSPEAEPQPETVIAPSLEPAPAAEAQPEPARPDAYLPFVPDVDERVDALLARQDAPAKRRKRAPVPAPTFEPLRREAWEDRLDAAIAEQ